MGFHFSLQTVLQYRENSEKQEEVKLQQVIAELVRVRDEAEQLAMHLQQTSTRRAQLLVESASAFDLHALEGEIQIARQRQAELHVSIRTLEQKKADQMQAYEQKRKARSVLDEMHKTQRSAFDKFRAVQEQKTLDDVFSARAQRD